MQRSAKIKGERESTRKGTQDHGTEIDKVHTELREKKIRINALIDRQTPPQLLPPPPNPMYIYTKYNRFITLRRSVHCGVNKTNILIEMINAASNMVVRRFLFLLFFLCILFYGPHFVRKHIGQMLYVDGMINLHLFLFSFSLAFSASN